MTIIHDEQNNQFSAKVPVVLGLCFFLLIGGGLTVFLVLRAGQPDDVEVAQDVTADAQRLFEQERYAEVIETLKTHLVGMVEREDVTGLRLFADSCLKQPMDNNRHLGAASEIYRRIIGFAPDDVESARRLAEIYASAGKTADAIKYAELSLKQQPDHVAWRLQLAEMFAAASRYDQSLEIVDAVLKEQPTLRSALQQRVHTMVLSAEPHEAVNAYIEESAVRLGSDTLRDEMRLMHAQIAGDAEVAGILNNVVADIEPENEDHARWLVSAVSAGSDVRRAAEVQARLGAAGADPKPTIYRYLQQNDFVKVEELLQQQNPDSDSELLVVLILSRWLSGDGDLSGPITKLQQHETQIARVWLPVVLALQEAQPDAALLAACDQALKAYPGSPWLYLIRGQALISMGEYDLAAQSYRIATRANPQWFQVRIELSRLRLRQADFASAFWEAAAAIRTQPASPVGYELAIVSALRADEAGQPLSEQAHTSLTTALSALQEATSDSFSQTVLPAVTARISGQPAQNGLAVQAALQQTELSAEQLEILRLLSRDEQTLAAIDARLSQLQGISVSAILTQAQDVADRDGLPAVQSFLSSLTTGGEPLPEISQRLLYAQTASLREPETGAAAWLALAEDYPDRARVLAAAIRSPAVRSNAEICRKVMELLKAATSDDGVLWQLADIRLQMNEDSSEKTSSAVALRLVDLIQSAPDCGDAYELMAIAMERLGRQDKVLTTLRTAVDAGIRRPEFCVRIAEIAVENGSADLAVEYAQMAVSAANPNLCRRAAGVLLTCKAYPAAAAALESVSAEQAADTDDDYATMTGLAVAYTQQGQFAQLAPRLVALAQSSDRWFQLWVDMSVLEAMPPAQSASFLEQASPWADNATRQRRLAGAWRKLADRSGNMSHWECARDAISAIPMEERTVGDQLVLSGLCERLGEEAQAEEIYEQVIAANERKELTAIALNNLALIDSRTGRFEQAEERAREAISISPRPEFADSLASIFVDQRQIRKAVDVLQKSRKQWPDSEQLKDRLLELQSQL